MSLVPLLALAALACTQSTPGSPLPTTACLAVPIGVGTIHGDSATPDRIVLDKQDGESVVLVDEANEFAFVFDPILRIVHVDGREAAREGDLVDIGGEKPDPAVPGTIGWCGDVRRLTDANASPTPTPTPVPTLFPTPVGNRPDPDGTTLGDSNSFWYGTIPHGPLSPAYSDLEQAVWDTQAIILGHVVDVRELTDPAPSDFPFYARVAEDEVLLGTVQSLTPGWFDLRLVRSSPATPSIEELAGLMPDHQSLFFLREAFLSAEELGHPPADLDEWRYKYATDGPGGLIRNIDGVARTYDYWLEYAPNFPTGLESQPFDEVVQLVRDEIARQNDD